MTPGQGKVIVDLFVKEYPNFEINKEEHNNNEIVKVLNIEMYITELQDVLKRLPPFDWTQTHYNDGIKRIIRGLMSGAGEKYEGEWI